MAVYRSDQAQLTMSAEAAQGGDPELISGTRVGGGSDIDTTLSAAANAGATQITVAETGNVVVGDFIRIGGPSNADATIGSNVTEEFEIRRIVHTSATSGAGTFFLDRPLAFFHPSGDDVEEVTNVANTDANEFYPYITTVPGIYEGVTLPDFTPSIEPRYLLGTSSDRNFTTAYSGAQTFSGALSSFVVVDATPLRFPIGTMKTNPNLYLGSGEISTELQTEAKKGDVWINVKLHDNISAGKFVHMTDEAGSAISSTTVQSGTNPEVVKVQSVTGTGTSTFVQLSQPLRFDHAENTHFQECAASPVFTHTIEEAFDLDTLTWNVLFRDTAETPDNDLQRRYVGGIVDSATISAAEGGMLMMSYDSVPFLDMVHNQEDQASVGTNLFNSSNAPAGMPRFALMNKITSSDIDFPTTEPYYFSQGSFKLFGQEFARVRSISISIANSVEPRYYISPRHGRHRGPSEFREGRRSYSMACTIALPDTAANTATTVNSANEIFKQLLLEGNFGDGNGLKGFNIELTFTRGTNDTIQILIPNDYTSGNESTGAATGLNEQGAFILSAPYNITGDPIIQTDVDILFRNMKIIVTDSKGVYI